MSLVDAGLALALVGLLGGPLVLLWIAVGIALAILTVSVISLAYITLLITRRFYGS